MVVGRRKVVLLQLEQVLWGWEQPPDEVLEFGGLHLAVASAGDVGYR